MDDHYTEFEPDLALLKALAVIPAPSGDEDRRAAFCLKWLKEHGIEDASLDEAGNVRVPFGDQSGLIDVFMAHSDVVFPERRELPYKEDDTYIHCPGIGDDTAHVTALMQIAERIARTGLKVRDGGLLFVINVGEEGLGNLKGSRQVVRDLGKQIRTLTTFDSVTAEVVTKAVGSVRWRVTVRTPGGHSFRDFGTPNAIECLASLIGKLRAGLGETARLYHEGGKEGPEAARMTWNAGTISGGTSVNTIAGEAEMLFECRADSQDALTYLRESFDRLVEDFRAEWGDGVAVATEVIGERPSMAGVDPAAHERLIRDAEAVIRKFFGEEPYRASGSTDANSALAVGIPAVCFGLCRGDGAHTYNERLRKDSLKPGLMAGWTFVSRLLKER